MTMLAGVMVAPNHAARLVTWALADAGMTLPEGSVSARPIRGEAWQAETMTVTVRVATEAAAEWVAGALAALGLAGVRRCVWRTAAGAPSSWEAAGTASDDVLNALDPRRVLDAPPLEPGPAPRQAGAVPQRAARKPRRSRAKPRPCSRCGRELPFGNHTGVCSGKAGGCGTQGADLRTGTAGGPAV